MSEAPPPPPMMSDVHDNSEEIPAPPPPLPGAYKSPEPASPPAFAEATPNVDLDDKAAEESGHINRASATPERDVGALAGVATPSNDVIPPPPEENAEIQDLRGGDSDEEEVEALDEPAGASVNLQGVKVIKEGWLKKTAGPLGIARSRYCVLYENGVLRYYSDADCSEEHRKGKGDVNFREIKQTTHDGSKFTVENENKVWQFEANDFVEAADWLSKFELPARRLSKAPQRVSISTSMTLEAYGENEREMAQKLHTL